MSKKHVLHEVRDWPQVICKSGLLLREVDAHMNLRTGRLIGCHLGVYYPLNI